MSIEDKYLNEQTTNWRGMVNGLAEAIEKAIVSYIKNDLDFDNNEMLETHNNLAELISSAKQHVNGLDVIHMIQGQRVGK